MTPEDKLKQERADAAWVMSTEQGRRFIYSVLEFCGVYHDFEGGVDQVMKQTGRRQVGLHVMHHTVDAAEMQYFEMLKEARNRSIEENKYVDRNTRNESTGNNRPTTSGTTSYDDIYDVTGSIPTSFDSTLII